MLHPDKTKSQLELTEQIKTYSRNLNMIASLVVSEIFKNFVGNPLKKVNFLCYILTKQKVSLNLLSKSKLILGLLI